MMALTLAAIPVFVIASEAKQSQAEQTGIASLRSQ
jgi:hypothetical protein